MSTTTLITADEFARMSFDVPVELVKGEIVAMTTPGGWHGRICARSSYLLQRWTEAHPEFEVCSNDSGVVTQRDPDSVRGPDLLVIRRDRLPNGKIPKGHFETPPDLAIEVRSPSDRWPELLEKVAQFLAACVPEVWVIDPDHRRIHVYRTDDEPKIVSEGETVSSRLLPGFSVPVAAFFEGL